MSERDDGLPEGWLAEQIAQAKREMAALPEWARRALRLWPDDDAPAASPEG